MGMRRRFAIALGAALFIAGLATPVPASTSSPTPSPTPGPTLAPIDDASTPDPSATGSPKVLGHIYTTAFCSNFVEHFNAATRIVISNDQNLDSVDVDLHKIEDDWNKTDGATRVYDERVHLIATVQQMMSSIPASQAEVNKLLAEAKITTDPDRKAALQESASQLQKTIDRQRAVTYDLSNVIHVLLDKHKAEDTAEYNINRTLPPGMPPVNITALDDPVPEPGTDTLMQPKPGASPTGSPTPAAVENIMQFSRQRWIIGNAESKAAVAADKIVRICSSQRPPTPPPTP